MRAHLPLLLALVAVGCGDSTDGAIDDGGLDGSVDDGSVTDTGGVVTDGPPPAETPPLPSPACAAAGGSATVAAPTLKLTLKDRWEEGWLGSPAVADLDGDGKNEIIVPRGNAVLVWNADGTLKWKYTTAGGRIWASAVVANFVGDAKLEVAVAARDKVYLLDAAGKIVAPFPVTFQDELRSLGAGDLDGDGSLELVASLAKGGPTDVLMAWRASGAAMPGFPPNGSGASGCAGTKCYLAGCYDQNLAIGDLDGDGKADLVAPHDNAYASVHHGSGVAFDSDPGFKNTKKMPGVRYLHALAEAQQGYANNEATALQAHFTNTAPAIADLDGDGKLDVLMLASVQNAAQTDRLKGVAVWAERPDGKRLAGWDLPFHAPSYLAGLWDFDGTNVVAATNQLTVADLDPASAGPELVFAGFDGKIHAVSAQKKELWSFTYTTDARVLTGGVVVGDLSADGVPEVVFTSYSPDEGKSALYVLDASGKQLHRIALPKRGAMPVPTLADVDGDGTVDIVVSLKDAEDKVESVRVYSVPGSKTNCLLWPTGRANLLRNGTVPVKK
ncbi:MAG: VCBS repeat-containing protein [Myxococcales bacterium]|nr:VCBS repeat-containing protein [Myxococcales bacterium]